MFAFLLKFCIIICYDSNSSKKKWKAMVVLVTFGKLLFIWNIFLLLITVSSHLIELTGLVTEVSGIELNFELGIMAHFY